MTIGNIPVLELDLPGGRRSYSDRGVAVTGIHGYVGKVLSWNSIERSVSEHDNALSRPEFVVVIDDNDKDFAHLIEGGSGHQVRRSAARFKLYGSGLVAWTEFSGKLDTWEQQSPHAYVLSLRQDDIPLEKKFPKYRLTQFDWPHADSTAIAQYAPIVFGVHDSNADTNEGMLPTYHIDTSGYRHLVSIGYVNVRRVYGDGTLISSGDYSITHPTVNGTDVTLVDFSADTYEDQVITVDCDGYDTDGDGGGTVIENPVTQLEYLLENFVYGDYRSGSWFTSAAPIADTEFTTAKDFADREGYEGAIYVAGDQIKGRDFVNAWLTSWDARAYWTRYGNIAPLFLDHAITDIYKSGDSWIRWERHEAGFSQRNNVDGITSRIAVRYVKNSVDGQLKQTIEVRDLSIDEENTVREIFEENNKAVVITGQF